VQTASGGESAEQILAEKVADGLIWFFSRKASIMAIRKASIMAIRKVEDETLVSAPIMFGGAV
jgi:hypothetical protein